MIVTRFRNQKGSALIITLLMIAVIGSVSFAITSLALSEFRKAGNIQDSIVAYYAAESGLEHGLMEYRLWHDAEISKEVYDHALGPTASLILPQDKIPTADVGQPQTFRLTGNTTETMAPGYVPENGDKGKSWYNLKMFYRGDKVGEVNGAGEPVLNNEKSPRVRRDSAAEYSINGAKGLRIVWKPDPATAANPPNVLQESDARYFLELTLTVKDGSTCPQPLHPILKVLQPTVPTEGFDSGLISLANCDYSSVRIKPWNMSYAQYSFVLFDQPTLSSNRLKIDQLKTTFQSTGYSGAAKRTLELNLSRTIGTILEAGDFLFLSGDRPLTF